MSRVREERAAAEESTAALQAQLAQVSAKRVEVEQKFVKRLQSKYEERVAQAAYDYHPHITGDDSDDGHGHGHDHDDDDDDDGCVCCLPAQTKVVVDEVAVEAARRKEEAEKASAYTNAVLAEKNGEPFGVHSCGEQYSRYYLCVAMVLAAAKVVVVQGADGDVHADDG